MGRAKRFRVLVAKDDRAIAGLSMGGGHTLAATNNNREIPGRHYWFLWRDFLAQYAQVMFQ